MWFSHFIVHIKIHSATNKSYHVERDHVVRVNAQQVSCGAGHTIICTTSGQVWACGYNCYGQVSSGQHASTHQCSHSCKPNPEHVTHERPFFPAPSDEQRETLAMRTGLLVSPGLSVTCVPESAIAHVGRVSWAVLRLLGWLGRDLVSSPAAASPCG